MFYVADRSLERWQVPGQFANGRNQYKTRELLEEAWARLNAAPRMMQGRHRAEAADSDLSHTAEPPPRRSSRASRRKSQTSADPQMHNAAQ
jgi:hypothetical protein